ncbi:MAG: hypothetical protein QXO30_04180 [Candidatus Caldarchaeum sp.]
MGETGNEAAEQPPQQRSRNPFFDEVVRITAGQTVLVRDETFSESREFLLRLFDRRSLLELVSPRQTLSGDVERLAVSLDNLQELSITINTLRRQLPPRIIVHSYLPELLVRYDSEQVLKLLNFWQAEVKKHNHVEFLLLPRNTFEVFERKLMAVVDGAIDLSVSREGNTLQKYFTPIRIAREEYHLKPIKYSLVNGDVVINAPKKVPDASNSARALQERIEAENDLMIALKRDPTELEVISDYFLAKAVDGLRVSWVKRVFPDMVDNVMWKIASWVDEGLLKLERPAGDDSAIDFVWAKAGRRLRFFSLQESVETLNDLSRFLKQRAGVEVDLSRLAAYLQELYSRLFVFCLLSNGRHMSWEKVLAMLFSTASDGRVKVRKAGKDEWVVELRGCGFCRVGGLGCEQVVSNLVSGAGAVALNENVACKEVECVESGGGKCVFRLSVVSRGRTRNGAR